MLYTNDKLEKEQKLTPKPKYNRPGLKKQKPDF